MKSKFFQKTPRCTATIQFRCHAKISLFLEWDKMTASAQMEFIDNGPVPCEGGGIPGDWCGACRFGKVGQPDIE